MHYTLTVALPGDVPAQDLRGVLDAVMDRFDENLEVDWHRDTSVYAEDYATTLNKAMEANGIENKYGFNEMSEAQIMEDWNGQTRWDGDGWPLTDRNPDGQWDWWVVGGRWGGAWVLREGAADGPLQTEDSSFGASPEAGLERRTDNARWADLCPESVTPGYAFVDLDGVWHTRWIGPTREEAISDRIDYAHTDHWKVPEAQHAAEFMKFLADLPADTWLVQVDYHN